MFTNGATQVELDGAGRILIPKKLLDYASAEKDVVLNAHLNKVEIWSKQLFEQGLSQLSDKDFEALAEKVMSKIDPNEQRKLS
jgi:MraZ protein